jgi:hypothetical protein
MNEDIIILDARKDWTEKEWQEYNQKLAETYEQNENISNG